MEHKTISILVTLIVSLVVVSLGIFIPSSISGNSVSSSGDVIYLSDSNNLGGYLEQQEIIQSIPSTSTVVLKTYGIQNREWVIEKSFVISGGSVSEADSSSYDAVAYIDSKYIENLKTQSLCDVLKTANSNGDLLIDSNEAATTLAWKFRGLWKYRECLE